MRRNDSQQHGISANVVVTFKEGRGGYDIDLSAEQQRERLFEMDEVDERTRGLELDQEVDVTRRRGIASTDRPEHRYRSGSVLTDERDDLVTVTFDQRTQRRRAQSHVRTLPADRAPRGACERLRRRPRSEQRSTASVGP